MGAALLSSRVPAPVPFVTQSAVSGAAVPADPLKTSPPDVPTSSLSTMGQPPGQPATCAVDARSPRVLQSRGS